MYGLSILMLIFAILIFLCGLYLFTGHKNELLLWKVHDIKKFTIKETKNVGKWTMLASIIPFIIAVLGYLLEW